MKLNDNIYFLSDNKLIYTSNMTLVDLKGTGDSCGIVCKQQFMWVYICERFVEWSTNGIFHI